MSESISYVRSRAGKLPARGKARSKPRNTARDLPAGIFCTTGYPVKGGVSSVISELIPMLSDATSIQVLAWRGERTLPGVTTFGVRWSSPFYLVTLPVYLLLGAWHLHRLLRRKPSDFILAHDGTYTAAYCCLVGSLYRCPVYIMDHGSVWVLFSDFYWSKRRGSTRMLSRPFERFYRRLLKGLAAFSAKYSTSLLVAGEESRECYRRRFAVPISKMHDYRYPVTIPPRPRRPLNPPALDDDEAIVVSTVGRATIEKGLPIFLSAAIAALNGRKNSLIVVAGDGPLREPLQRQFADSSVPIKWCGGVEREEVIELLHRTDVFVYAGVEGTNFSMAVLEAMAAGCAVVATDAPISNVALLSEGRGICLPTKGTQALRSQLEDALRRLLGSPAERRRMGSRASRFIEDHFRPSQVKPDLLNVLLGGARDGNRHGN